MKVLSAFAVLIIAIAIEPAYCGGGGGGGGGGSGGGGGGGGSSPLVQAHHRSAPYYRSVPHEFLYYKSIPYYRAFYGGGGGGGGGGSGGGGGGGGSSPLFRGAYIRSAPFEYTAPVYKTEPFVYTEPYLRSAPYFKDGFEYSGPEIRYENAEYVPTRVEIEARDTSASYVAINRGAIHTADLPGHEKSASSINIEAAPGTNLE